LNSFKDRNCDIQQQSMRKTIQYETNYVRGKNNVRENECSILHSEIIGINTRDQ